MLSQPQDHSAINRIRAIEKSNDLIGNLASTNYATTCPMADVVVDINIGMEEGRENIFWAILRCY
jgi:hypothetical protein